MMKKERLMEIRETLSNGDHLTRLDRAHLLALIDSALAEPSDEDIDRALDWILTGKYETQVGDHSYVADSRFHPDTSRFCNTIAQALRQYQKPTDEAVQKAIEWAEQERKNNFRYMNFGDADSAALAITALRQMRTEPCGWCKHDDCVQRLMNEMQSSKAYCPNCGKELVKHDG